MRRALLLLCLPLAACASVPGEPAVPAGTAAVQPAPEPPAPEPAARPRSAARGGDIYVPPPPAAPVLSEADRLTQTRADCWMKVEQEKGRRDIDRRIAFVDRCVADTMKAKPN